jgi:peroxiredoxin
MSRDTPCKLCALALLPLLALGCGADDPPLRVVPPRSVEGYDPYGNVDSENITFLDDVQGQLPPQTELKSLTLASLDGAPVTLGDVAPGRNLVVVMTRGFNGAVCPYCSTQTAQLVTNYKQLQALNTEVVLIYPLQAEQDSPYYQQFLGRVNSINGTDENELPPFPVVFDVGLKVVYLLGLRKDLSKPATYILDPQGSVRFAYVGETLSDRPSLKAILQQLKQLQPSDQSG